MRCPICTEELRDDATVCTECGCGILPPPPTGVAPVAYVREDTTPRWPLVLSIIGVVAALGVIAVALFPVFDDDDDQAVSTATSVSAAATTTAAGASTTAAAAASTLEATTTASTTTTAAPTTTAATTTTAAITTTAGASTSTVAVTTTKAAPTTTVAATTTTAATATTAAGTATTTGGALPVPAPITKVEATCTAPASTDSRGNPISFDAANVADANADTAWRCAGDSKRQALVLELGAPTDLGFVGGIPGWLSKDPYLGLDRWTQNRQVIVGRWGCLNAAGQQTATIEQLFDDRRSQQYMPVEGFVQCSKVVFEIIESSRPGDRDYTAISELGMLLA